MKVLTTSRYLIIASLVGLTACSNDDNTTNSALQSDFNENAPESQNTGEPGGDTSQIAGLWDGTRIADAITDEMYWHIAADGVLTRYDYQQDGVADANGENCYVVDAPVTVTPEGGDSYSFFNVAVTAERVDQTLTITFLDPDKNDIDGNGDTTETPTYSWDLETSIVVEELNSCTSSATSAVNSGGEDDSEDTNAQLPQGASEPLPQMSRAECISEGGAVIGDIGNGAIFTSEYRCESGSKPIARVIALPEEPIATDGEVCCL